MTKLQNVDKVSRVFNYDIFHISSMKNVQFPTFFHNFGLWVKSKMALRWRSSWMKSRVPLQERCNPQYSAICRARNLLSINGNSFRNISNTAITKERSINPLPLLWRCAFGDFACTSKGLKRKCKLMITAEPAGKARQRSSIAKEIW